MTQVDIDKFIKRDLKLEVIHTFTEIDQRFRRVDSIKGSISSKADKL